MLWVSWQCFRAEPNGAIKPPGKDVGKATSDSDSCGSACLTLFHCQLVPSLVEIYNSWRQHIIPQSHSSFYIKKPLVQLQQKSKLDGGFQWELLFAPLQQSFMCAASNAYIIPLISVGLLKLKYLVESEPWCIAGYRLKYQHPNILRGESLAFRCQDMPRW